jgi:hypothetical protein
MSSEKSAPKARKEREVTSVRCPPLRRLTKGCRGEPAQVTCGW